MSFRLAIPWPVALQQSRPPLRQLRATVNQKSLGVEKFSVNGTLSLNCLSHPRGQAHLHMMPPSSKSPVDLSKETDETRQLYGMDDSQTQYFGRQCLIPRRLVERGVRFIQFYSGRGHQQQSWDAHYGLDENHRLHCAETDKPITGLLKDLKRRGLLKSSLVVWGGEFGRMPISQSAIGRDHNPYGFTMWLAGGGVKGGQVIGATDELGYRAVDEPHSVHDLHATMLHCLGLDHRKLAFYYGRRDQRLANLGGEPILKLL